MTRLNGNQRVDSPGIPPQALHGVSHGGQIDQGRHAGEILEHDTRRLERDLDPRGRGGVPVGEVLYILLGHLVPIAISQDRFQEDADGVRQVRDPRQTPVFQP